VPCTKTKYWSSTNPYSVVKDRLDTWILPWIPHLDHPALILPNLLSDCKRKVKSTLSTFQRRIIGDDDDDKAFVLACLAILKPWQNVFDSKSLQRVMEDKDVTSRLSRYLSKNLIIADGATDRDQQDWTGLELVLELHARSLLSDIELLSVIEADILCP
jgi:GC-rich sequence DNA-binding factor-like protein